MDLPPRDDFPSSSSSLPFSSLPSLYPSADIFPCDSRPLAHEWNEAMVVNGSYPMANMETHSYAGYGLEKRQLQPPPMSSTELAASWADAFVAQEVARYHPNCSDPTVNQNTHSYTGYGPENLQSLRPPMSSTQLVAPWTDTFVAQELARHLPHCSDPTVNQNIHSYAGYGLENEQCQIPWMLSTQPVTWPGTVVDDTTQQPHWEPQYAGSQEEMSHHPYHLPAPILEPYSAMVMAESLPVVPPMGWGQSPPSVSDNSVAPSPLTAIPHITEGSDEYFGEQAMHSAAPTLASARDQINTEVATSHRAFAGRRVPTPLSDRPPAEDENQNSRKRRQIVGKDDPQAHAIAQALEQEIKACEIGTLECGPCYLRRKRELTVVKKSVDHEILYMLKYFKPPACQLRLVAWEVRCRFEGLVRTHLQRPMVSLDHPYQRIHQPGHWERNRLIRQDVGSEAIVFTRKDV